MASEVLQACSAVFSVVFVGGGLHGVTGAMEAPYALDVAGFAAMAEVPAQQAGVTGASVEGAGWLSPSSASDDAAVPLSEGGWQAERDEGCLVMPWVEGDSLADTGDLQALLDQLEGVGSSAHFDEWMEDDLDVDVAFSF